MKRKRFDPSQSAARRQADASSAAPNEGTWPRVARVAFRFSAAYLGLFSLATQVTGSLILIPAVSYRGMGQLWPMREITFWVADHALGVAGPLDFSGRNGETAFFLAQTLWILVGASLVAGVWSVLDRNRGNDAAVHKWFRLFVRFGLAAQMFEYGMTKVVPNQFEAPSLNILVTPAGDLSLNTILWTAIGSSPGYQMFTGWAELLGGVLLLVPRTTLAGALICLADMIHVFILNMTFDIGLKLTTLHLIFLALFLMAPDMKRLWNLLFMDRRVERSRHARLFENLRTNRMAVALQILFGAYLMGMQAFANVGFWYAEGGGSPRSPLYGVWNTERLVVDGEPRPPSENDYDRRWRRVIFDEPGSMTFQRTDDSFSRYGATIDISTGTITLTKGISRSWESVFTFSRPAGDRLVLDGEMDGYGIHLELSPVEFDTFRLLNSHFRWIRADGG